MNQINVVRFEVKLEIIVNNHMQSQEQVVAMIQAALMKDRAVEDAKVKSMVFKGGSSMPLRNQD